MARINIEDQLYTDGRYRILESLVGPIVAQGTVLHAYRIAQGFWIKDRSLIPKTLFNAVPEFSKLIEVGLAEERENGFYIKGSESQFDWIITRSENGKKGGRPKQETKTEPKQNLNITKEKPKHNLTETKTEPKQKLTEPKHNPQSQSQSQSLTQSLINNTFVDFSSTQDVLPNKFDFETPYQRYPNKEGKKKGLAKLERTIKTQKQYFDFLKALENFIESRKGKDKQYIQHFSTFANNWEDFVEMGSAQITGKRGEFARAFEENPYLNENNLPPIRNF